MRWPRWLLLTVAGCGPADRPAPPASVRALEQEWFGELKPPRTGRRLDRPPTLTDLRSSSWAGADSVLLVVATAEVTGHPMPIALESLAQRESAVDWAVEEAPDHPLAAFVRGEDGDEVTAAWQAWRDLRAVPADDAAQRELRARQLLDAWEGHPDACGELLRRSLHAQEHAEIALLFQRCDAQVGPLAALHAQWLDSVGDWRSAVRAYEAAGQPDHARLIQCVEAPEEAQVRTLQAGEPPPFALAWCVAAGVWSAAELPGLGRELARSVPASLAEDWALVRAAVLLTEGRAERARGLLAGQTSIAADLLRARAALRLGQTAEARATFPQLHAADPTDVHLLRAWSHADPVAAGAALLALEPTPAVLRASQRDRRLPRRGLVPPGWGPVAPEVRAVADVFDALHRASTPIPAGDSVWHQLARLMRQPGDCRATIPAIEALCGPPGGGPAELDSGSSPHLAELHALARAWSGDDAEARGRDVQAWGLAHAEWSTAAILWRLQLQPAAGAESVDGESPRR